MKGIYKFGIIVSLFLTITAASAITQIGDNILTTWVNASFFSGDGSNIFNINASNISSGTIAKSVMPANVTYNDSANTFGAVNQSFDTNLLFINALTNRVGIGTANPDELLSVNGTTEIYTSTGGTAFYANSTSGNVGIGTASPNYTLDVRGTVNASSFNGNGSGISGINASNITSGQIPSVLRLPAGTMFLINANETSSALITSSTTTAETRLMTYPLPANSYTTIILESEVDARENAQTAGSVNVSWRFNQSTTNLETFFWRLNNINTAGQQQEWSATLKISFPGGQGATTNLNLTGQIIANSGFSTTFFARSFRVYGVI